MSQEALQACIQDEQTYQFTHFFAPRRLGTRPRAGQRL